MLFTHGMNEITETPNSCSCRSAVDSISYSNTKVRSQIRVYLIKTFGVRPESEKFDPERFTNRGNYMFSNCTTHKNRTPRCENVMEPHKCLRGVMHCENAKIKLSEHSPYESALGTWYNRQLIHLR